MDFPFDVYAVITAAATEPSSSPNSRGSRLTVLSSRSLARLSGIKEKRASAIIDTMGTRSATAQGLPAVITTFQKVVGTPSQRVYICHDRQTVQGFLKTGKKHLFIQTRRGSWTELDIMCVLDFYVHEKCQRQGLGKLLFDTMLQRECLAAHQLGYDRPSPKLLPFLAKHHGLRSFVSQNNNYIVFDEYFKDSAGSVPSSGRQELSEDSSRMYMPISARPLSGKGSRPRRCKKRQSRQSRRQQQPQQLPPAQAQAQSQSQSQSQSRPHSTFPLRSVSPIRRPSSPGNESILTLLSNAHTPVKTKRTGRRHRRPIDSGSPRYSVLGTPLPSHRRSTNDRLQSGGDFMRDSASVAASNLFGEQRRGAGGASKMVGAGGGRRPPLHGHGHGSSRQQQQQQQQREQPFRLPSFAAPSSSRRMESAPAASGRAQDPYESHRSVTKSSVTASSITARRPRKKQAFTAASSMLLGSTSSSSLDLPAAGTARDRGFFGATGRRNDASSISLPTPSTRKSHHSLW